jgi:Secretion system C-terminal sorting domain
LYIDSTANDTTFIGVIPYSGNHPTGTYLMRIKSCLPSTTTLNANGMHVAGTFNNWQINEHTMFSFDGQKYEYIAYVDSTIMNQEYKVANGNSSSAYEIVPTACATNGNRTAMIMADLQLDSYEFGSCSKCVFTNGIEAISSNEISVYPNPANQSLVISHQSLVNTLEIVNVIGQVCISIKNHTSEIINTESLPAGIYFLKTISNSGKSTVTKFSIQH